MVKQRYNANDLAEILLEESKNFTNAVNKIQECSKSMVNTQVKIDPEDIIEFQGLVQETKGNFEEYLNTQHLILKKNRTRLPNWVIAILLGFFLAFVLASIYTYKQVERVNLLQMENQYLKSQTNK